jgi:murein DD-endopeptidase MepM/ murein hydrolase activator NlpD
MLTQKSLTQEHKQKLRWFVALSSVPLLGVLTAFGIMPQTSLNDAPGKTVTQEISLPQATPVSAGAATFWHSEQVQRGDTVADLLRRLGVEDAKASEFLRNDKSVESLRRLSVGKSVQAETHGDGTLLSLRYLSDTGSQIVVSRVSQGFHASESQPQKEQHVEVRSGELRSSSELFSATKAAGLPDKVARQLTDIFGGDVDFQHDLHPGDRFAVTYEETYINGEPVNAGHILAAEFINQGKTYRAAYFQTSSTRGDYYTPEGKSVHKAFLRSPVASPRISSGFTSSRFHPILKTWRAHKGVDFAAPMGAEVKTTADGVVSFVGQQNGYGNLIVIDHQNPYSTAYAHLSRFATGLHKGQRVTQGELIGYVGMTGWATGPHLHYEFRINGQFRDPVTVALPNATPLSASQKTSFLNLTREEFARVDLLVEHTGLAQNN